MGGSHLGEVTLKVESAIRDDLLRKSTKIDHQIPLRGIRTNGERIQNPELNGGDTLLLQVPYLQSGYDGSPVVVRSSKLAIRRPAICAVVIGAPLIRIVREV